MKVAAGIVLYNPDIQTLKKNVSSIIEQVDRVFVINNGDTVKMDGPGEDETFLVNKKIKLVDNKKNLGIAKALNQIIKLCLEEEVDWVMLLDQDSILERGAMKKLLEYTNKKDVSIVAPRIIDINKEARGFFGKRVEEVDMVITSGSLTNVADCKELGLFDEKMFIDFVDFDYCKRVRLADKKIIRMNNVELIHEVGKRTKKRFLWLTLYPTNHGATRVYYYARNLMYYRKKFKGKLSFEEKRYLLKTEIWKVAGIILYEKEKMSKLRSYLKGRKDGKIMEKKARKV